ncbi:unnamed protein product [Hermetia illucens]|uniref:Uncharacterized protein n=1 Tax=Hermetia illucens TaxID=343691 RepID=A0A7R8YYE6_HERIL|nr:unnamed protein product [Hermetia illucens]
MHNKTLMYLLTMDNRSLMAQPMKQIKFLTHLLIADCAEETSPAPGESEPESLAEEADPSEETGNQPDKRVHKHHRGSRRGGRRWGRRTGCRWGRRGGRRWSPRLIRSWHSCSGRSQQSVKASIKNLAMTVLKAKQAAFFLQ